MHAYHAASWESFFVAEAGASAALAGLLFVAISINLNRILEFPSLPGRAAETIVILVNALVIASVGLMPGQSNTALGLEVLVLATATWAVVMWLQYRNSRHPVEANEHSRGARFLLTQVVIVPFIVGGVTIAAEAGGGLYWGGAGVVVTFIAAALTAWVLLVEIMR